LRQIKKYKGDLDEMRKEQFSLFMELLKRLDEKSPFYQKKFRDNNLDISLIKSKDDIESIPLTSKDDLREVYPLGLQAVQDEDIVRIHSSSGTTGMPVIIPYTQKDVNVWSEMMARCFEIAGVTKNDRVQVTPGYGLWTAGIGFQAGVERLGAMAIPTGPGNTQKQIQMFLDLKTTVLTSTSSYALLLAEEIERQALIDKIHLRKAIIGSERWGEKMRKRIEDGLGVEIYDIYGLTEIYGPGIALDCYKHTGMHFYDDYLYFEIIDPVTEKVLPEGEIGELVITTLVKEGAPLLRFRTRDLTRIIPGECKCGSKYPRIDRIFGRTDDMIKVKGVNIFPGQVDELLSNIYGVSSEYQILINHVDGKDILKLKFEYEKNSFKKEIEERIGKSFKKKIGIKIETEGLEIGQLPRSEKKTKRVYDYREE
jgi:phenylacetate-CoA ligase